MLILTFWPYPGWITELHREKNAKSYLLLKVIGTVVDFLKKLEVKTRIVTGKCIPESWYKPKVD